MLSSAARRPLAVAAALARRPRPHVARSSTAGRGRRAASPSAARRSGSSSSGFDGMDPTLARKWMDEGKLPEPQGARRRGHLRAARLHAALRVAHRLVELRDGGEPRKAQHLRLPHPGPGDLLPGPEHGAQGAAEVPLGAHPDAEAEGHLDARRDVLLEDGLRRRHPERRPHRPRDVPARGAAPRRDARRLAAARRARDDGHLLLLGDRPLRLRGGPRHRVRRVPEAAALRRRRLRDRPQGPREPDPASRRRRRCGRRRRREACPTRSRPGSTSSRPARTSTSR